MRALVPLLVVCLGNLPGARTVKAASILPVSSEFAVGEDGWGSFGWKVGTSHANVLRLGNKFQLSGIGDGLKNDEWLRLFDVQNRGFYGGLAAGKLWAKTVIATRLQFGNTWRLSASETEKDDWLRLTSAEGTEYYGGLATGKLKTKAMTVEGSVQTKTLQITDQFLFKPQTAGSAWLQLADPVSKAVHKEGGLVIGGVKATTVTVDKVLSTTVFKLGNKFQLHGAGDAIKDDEYLRLMGNDGQTLYGGFASARLWSRSLKVEQDSTFLGTAKFQSADFTDKVTFKHAEFDTLVGKKAAQVGNVMLSNIGMRHNNNDWLHVYRADGKTYGGVAMGELRSSKTSTSILHLGTKWRLSGAGDKFHNDDWLRLMNTENTGYYGGLALKKLWTPKAYNHVLQLGTKWRLSGVGDKFKDDEWLRLMDIQNTKLYGGFEAAKMQTQSLRVKGLSSVDAIHIKERFSLVGTMEVLKVMNTKQDTLRDLEVNRLKAAKLEVAHTTILARMESKNTIVAKSFEASSSLTVGGWRFEASPKPVSADQSSAQDWLRLVSDTGNGKLRLGAVKAAELISTGKATSETVHTSAVHTKTATVKEMKVTGKLHVTEGIWVGNQRITPVPNSLLEEVKALKDEVASLKLELSQMRQ